MATIKTLQSLGFLIEDSETGVELTLAWHQEPFSYFNGLSHTPPEGYEAGQRDTTFMNSAGVPGYGLLTTNVWKKGLVHTDDLAFPFSFIMARDREAMDIIRNLARDARKTANEVEEMAKNAEVQLNLFIHARTL